MSVTRPDRNADGNRVGRIITEDIAAVRDRTRLDELIGERVELRSAGPTSLKGLCPFHEERSPSFHVSLDKNLWHCFGCGLGGDAIDFVRRSDGLAFHEAVHLLADKAGYELRFEETTAEEASRYAQQRRLRAIVEAAHRRYRQAYRQLPADAPAKQFLAERGFDPEADGETFGLGYAPAGRDQLLSALTQKDGYTVDDVIAAGLAATSEHGNYDRFRDRLLWPIADPAGRVVGFGGRKLDSDSQGPKYLNSPETPLYRKSDVLYNLSEARKNLSGGVLLIVEGYTDVMACHAAGFPAAVASCGTAFGADHAAVLRRAIGDDTSADAVDVVFTFDGDTAGREAALKAFRMENKFARHTMVAVAPEGLDPCDVRASLGNDALRALIDERIPLFEFALQRALDRHDLTSPQGRADALDDAAAVLVNINDDMIRATYDRWVASRLGLDVWRVSKHVRQWQPPVTREHLPADAAPNGPPPQPTVGSQLWLERESLKAVLQAPQDVADWYASVEPTAFTDEQYRQVHDAVAPLLDQSPAAADTDATRIWLEQVSANAGDVGATLSALVLEPLTCSDTDRTQHVTSTVALLLDADAKRSIERTRAEMAGLLPESPEFAARLEFVTQLQQYRRELSRN